MIRAGFLVCQKLVFDRLTEIKGTAETNKSNPSAYIGTLGFDLCSKSKLLAQQASSLANGERL